MLIPLRVDVPTDRLPIANVVLIILIMFISAMGLSDPELINRLGGAKADVEFTDDGWTFMPRLDTSEFPLPVLAITSLFVHAGVLHLLGNMLFMYIFGYGVNYKFGQISHVILFLVSGFIASMTHYSMTNTPVVGASGAIYGLMGAFVVYFCRNDITVFWLIWLRPGVSTVSSGWIIALWVAWDALSLATGTEGGVAIWAHLGGFATGVVAATVALRMGWVKPTCDEQTIYEVLGVQADWATDRQ